MSGLHAQRGQRLSVLRATAVARRPARRTIGSALLLIALLGVSREALGQHLPGGTYRPHRERSYDLRHYRAELHLDLRASRVSGRATLDLSPLRAIDHVRLDAIDLDVRSVSLLPERRQLEFSNGDRVLDIVLPDQQAAGLPLSLEIDYECTPAAGMYFQPDPRAADQVFVHTYGEGGLHANWLPIYAEVDDKFTSEMVVSVPRSYTVVSNGTLVETSELPDGELVYHWRQGRPHSSYLIAIYVGDFERGTLEPAFGEIPLAYWVPRGSLEEGAWAFRNTTRMVEFYSRRFDYRYPWVKYDQIAVPDYGVGAMEHTGVTGHNASVLRRRGEAPLDFGPPELGEYWTDWTAEATISHELAHHWFGDDVTCRTLGDIWLNESFASYLMMLWAEESLGRDQLLFDVELARRHYIDYVHEEHVIRPLSYPYYDSPDEIYNTEHTYLKGAVVLHMLRRLLGDDQFFGGLSKYLHAHELGNVETTDLERSLEEATGRNLDAFFDQWVRGGGHPVLDIGYRYLPDRKLVDLEIEQVQAQVEGQGLFDLSATVTLGREGRVWTETIHLDKQRQHFLLSAPSAPEMVVFDGEGDVLAEIAFAKTFPELLYAARHAPVVGRLHALDQLVHEHGGRPETARMLRETLERDGFWGLQAEAARLIGGLGEAEAASLQALGLASPDYRVRKATVLALADLGTPDAEVALRQVIGRESHPDVVAPALVALARVNPRGDTKLFVGALERPSWYDEIRIGALDALAVLARPELVAVIGPYAGAPYNQDVRRSALLAWEASRPDDPALHRALRAAAGAPPLRVQLLAIDMLGRLGVEDAVSALEELVRRGVDDNLTARAREALDGIARLQTAPGGP